ncbi:hypothetical protein [Sporosarcina beigongshangi]|uniref:hypothetical protein n=1 Tax=Sporosarcina beigongshangi TaxID=2782538 RepID=UPI002ACE2257|nr:hypothetical protein [Sporosarcina beigongshangi]
MLETRLVLLDTLRGWLEASAILLESFTYVGHSTVFVGHFKRLVEGFGGFVGEIYRCWTLDWFCWTLSEIGWRRVDFWCRVFPRFEKPPGWLESFPDVGHSTGFVGHFKRLVEGFGGFVGEFYRCWTLDWFCWTL